MGFSEAYKEAFWRIYAAKTEAEEKPFMRALKTLFNRQEAEVIANLTEFANPDFNEDKANETFAKSFKPLITGVFEAHYRDTIEGLKPRNPHAEGIKQEEFLDPVAMEWISNRSLSLAKMVNGTTKEQLRKALAEGYLAGEGADQMAERIKDFYRNGYEIRAPMVARTEVIAASAEADIKGYRDTGIKMLEFYPALDERSCNECLALVDGNPYPVGETRGIIAVHPNCRCIWLPIVE